MSRFVVMDGDGAIRQGIVNMDDCRCLINDVCCNDRSDQCFDLPHTEEYCKKRCPHFTKEDGIIRD